MSVLSANDLIALTAFLSTLAGIGITWAIYHDSERAELPGGATIPDPMIEAEPMVDNEGRTL